MQINKKNKNRFKSNEDSGFGNSISGRFLKRDGEPNVKRIGVGILERYSWYHIFIALPFWKFLMLISIGYVIINLFFATIYFLLGVEHLTGIRTENPVRQFSEAFFFSTQTFTTVGFGRVAPYGFWTSLVAAVEAFLGLLSFSLATGLFYGKFSKPKAFLKFSTKMIIVPYKEGHALMFRVTPYKNNLLTDAHAILNCAIPNGSGGSGFFKLKVEVPHIDSLSLNWTVVHYLDQDSPLSDFDIEALIHSEVEILVQIRAFDEVFSSTVVQRVSYHAADGELVMAKKFMPMYFNSKNQDATVLDVSKLDHYIS